MKTLHVLGILTTSLTLSHPVSGQEFVNLDFEDAQVVVISSSTLGGYTNYSISASAALPGWSAFSGRSPLSEIEYNPGGPFIPVAVSLIGSNASVFDGNFSVSLGSRGDIAQTGLVPADARSLIFSAIGSPLVFLGSQSLSCTVISNGTFPQSYSTYAADISALAGQVETLSFWGGVTLDDIQFSPLSVPEPTTQSLIGVCPFLLWLRIRMNGLQTPGKGRDARQINEPAAAE